MLICRNCGCRNESGLLCGKCREYLVYEPFGRDSRHLLFSLLLSGLAYIFFYGIFPLPALSSSQGYIYRIFTNHLICRAIAFLFFWGMFFCLIKFIMLYRQNYLFRIAKTLDIPSLLGMNLSDIPRFIEQLIMDVYAKNNVRLNQSQFLCSLYEITRKQSVNIDEFVNDHFSSLYERLESGFSIIRIFIWVLPVLGFMGTILGITSSIDGFTQSLSFKGDTVIMETQDSTSINQVFSSLTKVTDGLRTAFDTTFIGLFLVIPLMVTYTLLKNKCSDFARNLEALFKADIVPVIYPAGNMARSQTKLYSLHPVLERLNETSRSLSENIQILSLRIDRMTSAMNPEFSGRHIEKSGDEEE